MENDPVAQTAIEGNSANPVEQALAVVPDSVTNAWISFDLNERRSRLDEEGLQIAQRQDTSAESRKELAGSTRNFKRNKLQSLSSSGSSQGVDLTAISKSFNGLLKEYQSEIDTLTARAKAAESAFLALYKALYEVPDPVDELKRGLSDRATLEQCKEEMRALQQERSGLAERSSAVEKYESQIESLTSENKTLHGRVAEEVKKQVEARHAQWLSTHHKAMEAYELREQELLHQLSAANVSLREQQSSVDSMKQQRDDVVMKLEEIKKAGAVASEMIEEDNKRAREEVIELRHRCFQLESQISSLLDNNSSSAEAGKGGAAAHASALAAELAAKEVEVSQLKDQVVALQEVLAGQNEAKSADFANLSETIKNKDEEITSLKNKMASLPTVEEYETMKQQYEALQSFQLNDHDMGAIQSTSPSSSNAEERGHVENAQDQRSSGSSIDFEKRLLAKLKATESSLTAMRVDVSSKENRIKELSDQIQTLEDRNSDQSALIVKLEEGINAITANPSSRGGIQANLFLADRANTSDELTGGNAGHVGEGSKTDARRSSADENAWDWGEHQQAAGLQKIIRKEPTMLDIVAGQRDRFRTRTQELEDENRKTMERLERVLADLDGLKSDNVRLYEKIRYLQSYGQTNSSSSGIMADDANVKVSSRSRLGSVAIGFEDDDAAGGVLDKYRSMYEEMVNPYTLFNRRERHKRLSEMSAPERLTFRASQRVLRTKASRLFVFFYVMALHMLVFFVLALSAGRCSEMDVTTKGVHH